MTSPAGGRSRTDALIDIKGVKLAYETEGGKLPVLDGVDMRVPEGGFVAVVGPSGCGKSTLTRLIAGLLEPNAGEVWLHGQRVTGPKSSVGMAFQNPVLLEWRSVLRNVTLPLELVAPKMPRQEKDERARQLLALVGLEGFEDKRPSELSGGMRQRASLCRSIVHKPEVLILDEPFGALDAFTREDLWQTMHKVKSEEPFTGVMITHDLRESIFLGDTVIVLSGRPAITQYTMKVPWKGERDLGYLYSPEATEMLGELRHQIQIAQGRSPREEGA
ncbi:MAG: ABC transporter ATP-binding protein [Rhodobacteraceae bacterium]|nr:ABC transporter ATP-binding protein [Paracoccaceae bacterium]MCY4139319.1 ABC transporter ATP-binding protein [Paracoccaceae bacterium]